MSEFNFSKHALEMIEERNISMQKILAVLRTPFLPGAPDIDLINNKIIYQAIVNFEEEGDYLVRVFVNISKDPPVVITVYRTSKIDKYYESKIR